jgi:serine/threonine-protein kinase
MSEVWLAKHSALAIPVILKTIRRPVLDAIGAEKASQRLLLEARLMARVTNPRVVRALDGGTTDAGVPFLVQEYVDGLDLAELDRRRRAILGVGFPLWYVCFAMQEICEALHAAHQAGVVHRDVKPSNVFGSPETGVRLGDFGIAVTRAEDTQRETSGTMKFMAPEQFRGERIDRRTDVYGAGATACDLRYGHGPFPFVAEILDPEKTPHFPPPGSPQEAYFQHLIGQMVEKDPRRRPETAAEAGRHFRALAQSLKPHIPAGLMLDRNNALRVGQTVVSVQVGDIALAEADALVSSANFHMHMRTGVGDALRRAGGDVIEDEAKRHGEQALGACVRTGPGTLKARHVFHAVSAWNEVSCVGRAMSRALLLADEHGCRSLGICALGTGAGRVSMEMSANAMMTALRWHALLGGSRLKEIKVYTGDESKRKTFQEVAEEALRGQNEPLRTKVELGLPSAIGEASAEGATCLDTSKGDPHGDDLEGVG